MARRRLADQQWELIADIFPEPAATGRPPVDPRDMMDRILWRLRTGSPWRIFPKNSAHAQKGSRRTGRLHMRAFKRRFFQQNSPDLRCRRMPDSL